MDKKEKYTSAIIGLGRIGYSLGLDRLREQPASHTAALYKNKRIKIIAGCDTNADNLSRWKKANARAEIFDNVEHLFSSVNPDIVTVAVNEDSHLQVAVRAIKAKPKLLILEKPVALNMKDAQELEKISEEYNVPVLVNHERRYALDYNMARDYLSEIGEIQEIHGKLNSGLRVYSSKEESTGAYSLLHDGTHLVDIILFFLEKIEGKACSLNNPYIAGLYKDKEGNVRNLSALYSCENCPLVEMNISGRSRFFEFGLDILGTEGRISLGNGYFNLYKRKPSSLYTGFYSLKKDKKYKKPGKTFYFSNMVQNAVDFLDGKCELVSNLHTGMNALSVLEDIKKLIK